MGSVFLDKIKNKRIYLKVNTKPEKIAVAAALSAACALIFNEKKKKIKHPKKYHNIIQRTIRNYKLFDVILTKTIAKETAQKTKEQFKDKSLNNLEIENGEFIEI